MSSEKLPHLNKVRVHVPGMFTLTQFSFPETGQALVCVSRYEIIPDDRAHEGELILHIPLHLVEMDIHTQTYRPTTPEEAERLFGNEG